MFLGDTEFKKGFLDQHPSLHASMHSWSNWVTKLENKSQRLITDSNMCLAHARPCHFTRQFQVWVHVWGGRGGATKERYPANSQEIFWLLFILTAILTKMPLKKPTPPNPIGQHRGFKTLLHKGPASWPTPRDTETEKKNPSPRYTRGLPTSTTGRT